MEGQERGQGRSCEDEISDLGGGRRAGVQRERDEGDRAAETPGSGMLAICVVCEMCRPARHTAVAGWLAGWLDEWLDDG
eukprot:363322-Chlamydomonas_euryale.AAC.11